MKFKRVERIFRIESNRKGTGIEVSCVGTLVRCKDCKYNDGGFCDEVLDGKGVDEEFFCGCGTRSEYDETGT